MVVNIIDKLHQIGFTEYEAKAYIALLQSYPATAYEIARESAIPTSKIYEVMAKLTDKGVVSLTDDDKKKRYIPISPDEFVEKRRDEFDKTMTLLKRDLASVAAEQDVSIIWNIRDYEYLVDKALRMIGNAKKNILISGWKNEFNLLQNAIEKRTSEGIKIAVVHFGDTEWTINQLYHHPIEDTIFMEKGGRALVIVADGREAIIGNIAEDMSVEGAWSSNIGFATLAEDYIKHDIYIMKIVKRFESALKERFGDTYEKLRDIFRDEEAE
jgi:sugar-specific transcriptional regulator TrmB